MNSDRWVTLAVAAATLGTAATALRRTIERRARLADDGTLEAVFDGIRARKLAGRWRVNFGPGWNPDAARDDGLRTDPACARSSSRSKHAPRPEKE
jgi:hypothetical protein